jgi:cellulose biosynthesis protein BcsQ
VAALTDRQASVVDAIPGEQTTDAHATEAPDASVEDGTSDRLEVPAESQADARSSDAAESEPKSLALSDESERTPGESQPSSSAPLTLTAGTPRDESFEAGPDEGERDGSGAQSAEPSSSDESTGLGEPTQPERPVDAEVPSSVDMAPPQSEIVRTGPRDEVWGQDRPGPGRESATALNELIESVTMSASAGHEMAAELAEAGEIDDVTGVLEQQSDNADRVADLEDRAADVEGRAADVGAADVDPDLMDELPSDRPVPADAIKRASEALDAAVNAAPAVIGSTGFVDDDEAVAFVDSELTYFDGESGSEAEPEDVASDYSVRVTDPIPVQSLSAPGVSRETSGSVQTPLGTQQPTGGPHGSDDERRSALIATVPAADDTTPVAAELAMDARRRIELQGRRFPRPPKTRIITVANQKGGVGKTTTTVNVAAGLAQSGLNVLVIDNDPQGNASTALGIEHRAGTPSVYEVLVEGESLANTVQQCPDVPNLWGVPATIDLSGSEIELVSLVSRETRLRKAIDKYLADRLAAGEERIDYVLIDCPPSLGLLTVNAFVAGREVFIPIQCEYYALEGLSQLLKTIDLIRSHLNPELRVSSILLTMYDGRTNLAQQVAGEVRSHFPAETFKTTIPRSVRISEAPSYGQTVMTYDPSSTGALAYLQASRELAERGQGGSSPRRAMKAEPVGAQD